MDGEIAKLERQSGELVEQIAVKNGKGKDILTELGT